MILSRCLPSLALATLLFSACGESKQAAPRRVKLVDLPHAELTLAKSELPPKLELVNSARGEGFKAWTLFGDAANPNAGANGLIEKSVAGEGADQVVTLSGERGAIYRLVEAQPNAYYAFSAEVRARALTSDDEKFYGATPWIAEMLKRGGPDELFGGNPQEYIYHRELFPSAIGSEGWQKRSRIFVTGPDTKMLLVAMCLAFTEKVKEGEVSFRSVKLEQVPRQQYLDARLDWAVGVRAAGTDLSDGWRTERLVRGNLGGEVRPSIVLLPGESLSFKVRLPDGEPHFESGVGFWDPSLGRGGNSSQSFSVEVSGDFGRVRSEVEQEASGDRSASRWSPLDLDLRAAAGQEVQIKLSLQGDVPGMFGAPQVLDRSRERRGPNVVLVSIDTLRADHVGAYGATQGQTPRIDAFAREGILFKNMVGQAPYTLPGHASILSGQHPGVHGLQQPGQLLSPMRSPILTRILSREGYATQAFTGGGYVNVEFGFARDFDGFVNLDPWRHRSSQHFKHLISRTPPPIKRVSVAADQGLYITQAMVEEHGPEGVKQWITDHKQESFFLFIHSFAIHDYEPPPGYLNCAKAGCSSDMKDYEEFKLKKDSEWGGLEISEADKQHLKHRYDAALRYTDERFGELLDHLDSLGLAEDTIVILATDHGEEMFERGFIQHGKSLYEELTQVPLIMRIPGQRPRVIETPAMQIDILPTVLAAMGIERDGRIQGIDLITEGDAGRATWSEIEDHFVEIYSYRSGDGWKLIQTPKTPNLRFRLREEWQLFNLNADPGENQNLAQSEPERLAQMQKLLLAKRSLHQDLSLPYLGQKGGEVSESTQLALDNLGYGGGDEDDEDN